MTCTALKHIFNLILFSACLICSAQKKNNNFQLHIQKAKGPIDIDGAMNETAWQAAEAAGSFYMVLPMDTSKAMVNTEVKMTYDEKNIYIIAICHLPKPGPYMVESLRRDFVFGKNDNFIFFLDPYNDLTNGYTFGVNAAGPQ